MGDHSGQALQRLLLEDGEVPVLPGESPRSQHRGGYGGWPAGVPSFLISLTTTALTAVEGSWVSREVFLSYRHPKHLPCVVFLVEGWILLSRCPMIGAIYVENWLARGGANGYRIIFLCVELTVDFED